MATQPQYFECHLYVSGRDRLLPLLPRETGPRRVATFAAIEPDRLVDPGFRRLLAALDLVTQTAA